MLRKVAAVLLMGAGIGMWVSCSTTTSSKYLYAAIPASNEIVVYREDPNSGVLTQLSGSPIAAGTAVQALIVHPSGKFLYAANSGATPTGNISLFTISTGALAEVTPRTNVGTAPTLLAMDSAGSFLYVGNAGSFSISTFSINSSSGALTPVGTYQTGLSPINMALSPSGNFLYITGQATQGYVEVFAVNQGVLTALNPVSAFVTGNDPFGLVIDSNGSFLYTANKIDNTISEFAINSDGSLTQLSNSPIGETFSAPAALLIDKSAKYLYVANQSSTNLAAYSIGSDGALTLLTSSPFGTGTQPDVIATDANGKYLFVGNQANPGSVQSFSLDTGSGTLTSVQTYSLPGNTTSIAVTP